MSKPIDNDTFEWEGEAACISGFGEDAKGDIRQSINDAVVAGYDNPADAIEVVVSANSSIDELVRWCRHHNGERQRLEQQLAAVSAERDRLRGLCEVVAEKMDKDELGSILNCLIREERELREQLRAALQEQAP